MLEVVPDSGDAAGGAGEVERYVVHGRVDDARERRHAVAHRDPEAVGTTGAAVRREPCAQPSLRHHIGVVALDELRHAVDDEAGPLHDLVPVAPHEHGGTEAAERHHALDQSTDHQRLSLGATSVFQKCRNPSWSGPICCMNSSVTPASRYSCTERT